MSRIFRDSSVLNQFGSPSINSNTLANRPTFGQPGRLFVSTDTLAIFRDTGTAWDNLTAGGGTIGTLQQVTTLGSRTNQNIFIGPTAVTPSAGVSLDVYGYEVIRNTVDSAANLGPIFYSQYSINYNGTTLSGFANSVFAQDIYNVSANTTVASSTQSGTSLNINTYKFTSASTITFSQPAGTIRAASALTAYSQFQNTAAGTITHAAGIAILGIENIGGSGLSITNNYQLLINASDEFASTATITNRWGVYQNGANDVNYFAGKILVNTTTASSYQLDVNGSVRIFGGGSYPLIMEGGTNATMQFSQLGFPMITHLGVQTTASIPYGRVGTLNNYDFSLTVNNSQIVTATKQGNFLIGTLTDTTRKLVVAGEQEWITTVGTGAHTTSGNHLPIWVNGTQYWLALLNPPILP
jgi:hypothetical protein